MTREERIAVLEWERDELKETARIYRNENMDFYKRVLKLEAENAKLRKRLEPIEECWKNGGEFTYKDKAVALFLSVWN